MYVLHVAPFEATLYPPLINTVHVSASWGLESAVVASTPIAEKSPLRGSELIAAEKPLARAALHRFLVQAGMGLLRRRGRPALVIGHNVYGLPVASVLAAAARAPLVYHCHDFHGSGSAVTRVLDVVERSCAPFAGEIWVPAPERERIAAARRLRAPVRVVRNCPRLLPAVPVRGKLRAWLAAQGSKSGGRGKLITRHGASGPPHLIREVIEIMPQLPQEAEFVFVGRGDGEYMRACSARARELGLADRVFVHPFVPHDQLFELLVDGDVASGLYGEVASELYAGDDPNVATPAPNKVYENLALGVPVVVPRGGSLEEDVAGSGAGAAVALNALERELAPAFQTLFAAEGVGARGRTSHVERFNYEAQLRGTLLHSLRRA